MDRKLYRLLSILLLVFASTDDVWAKCSPSPFDDFVAAENNQYLSLAGQRRHEQRNGGDAVPAHDDHSFIPPSRAIPFSGRTTERDFSVPFSPDPLYVLMSLQQ